MKASNKKSTWRGATSMKREMCPECSKKGIYPIAKPVTVYGRTIMVKECRYCFHSKELKHEI